jgi:hypothetical protein
MRDNAMSSDAELAVSLSIEAQFPQHFFLENIAVRQDNSKLVTVVKPYALYYLPARDSGGPVEPVLLHTFGELAGGHRRTEAGRFRRHHRQRLHHP